MQKILVTSIALGISIGFPFAALADSYNNFIRKQVAEFENPNSGKCKEKTIKGGIENGAQITYNLCIYKNKPVFLRTNADDTPISVSTFKGGKVVRLSFAEATIGVGFRNAQPVVEWNAGEFGDGKRGVNWNLNAEQKSRYLKSAATDDRILRKFGL